MLLVMEDQQWLLINGKEILVRGLMQLELTMLKLMICLLVFMELQELIHLEEMLLLEPVLQHLILLQLQFMQL